MSSETNDPELERLSKQIAKGGGIAFIGSIVGKLLTLLLHILLGRVLGPGAYGLYALGASVTGIVRSLASLGLNQGVVRFCSMYMGQRDTAKVKGTVFSALAISTFSSAVMAAILYTFSDTIAWKFFDEQELAFVLKVFALALPFYVLVGITTSVAQAFKKIEYQQGVQNIFTPVVNLTAVSVAFLLGYRLEGAVLGFLISGILSAALGFYLLWKIFIKSSLGIKPLYRTNELLRYSLPMIFIGLSYFLAFQTDRIMLGLLSNAKDVGVYTAAAAISMNIGFIHAGLVTIFMPIIADVYNKKQHLLVKELYNTVKRWSSYATFMLALPLIFYPKFIMSIYGDEFIIAWSALLVLSASRILGTITGPTGALLQMSGKQNIEFFNGVVWVMSNIILNYILIPLYGFLGAAIATLLASIVLNLLQVIEIYYFFRYHPFNIKHLKFITLALFSLIMATLVNIFEVGVFKLLSFMFIIIILMAYIYLNRTKEDIVIWISIKKRFMTGVIR